MMTKAQTYLYSFLATLLAVTSSFDGALTLHAIVGGRARELNPIWRPIIAYSPKLFIFLKITTVTVLCCFLLEKALEDKRLAQRGLWLLCSVYCALLAWHVAHLPL